MANFKISDTYDVLPKSNLGSQEEKYQFIAGELDVIIEKAVREGQFDISKGFIILSGTSDSVLSQIDEYIITRYQLENGWKIKLNLIPRIEIGVPTYLYEIAINNSGDGNPLSNQQVNFVLNQQVIPIGLTNELGMVSVNLTELLTPSKVFPGDLEQFLFEVNGFQFSIPQDDTEYKYNRVTIEYEQVQHG